MNRYLPIAILALSALSLPASAATLPGNATAGKQLLKQHCLACHVSMFGGDGTSVFTRKNRKVTSLDGLIAQIHSCGQNIGAPLTKDQTNDIVKYLNDTYYKFKK